MRVAFSIMAWNTGSNSPDELEMTCSTSVVAACCSRASLSEALAALDDARAVKAEYLQFRAAVTHDRQVLAALNHERALVQAQLTEFDPQTMSLQ
jgi:hypothetical protein